VIEFLQSVADRLLALADQNLYLAILLWVGLEEAGVPFPVPGDTILLFAGTAVQRGTASWPLVVVTAVVATWAGSSVLYWVARRGGHPLVARFGKYIHLTPERLARAETTMRTNAGWAIIVGRLVPGLRIVTTVAAGVFLVPYPIFLIWTTVATLIWVAIYLVLGNALSERLDVILAWVVSNPLLVILIVLAIVGGLLWNRRRRRARRAVAEAGP
jgi:membrane protein DedA with SNARE-associated domain